jgi:hypothetical protein
MKKTQEKQKARKNVQLGFEAPPELVEKLRLRAQAEDRSVSNLLRRFAIAALEADNISPVADDSGSDLLVGNVRGAAEVLPRVAVAAGGKLTQGVAV